MNQNSMHHPPIKLVRLQVHDDMMQIINITDLSVFALGSLQFEIGTEMFLSFDAECFRVN